jgi:hypothetical protein
MAPVTLPFGRFVCVLARALSSFFFFIRFDSTWPHGIEKYGLRSTYRFGPTQLSLPNMVPRVGGPNTNLSKTVLLLRSVDDRLDGSWADRRASGL